VPKGIGKARLRPESRAVDPIEPRAGNLHQFECGRGLGHLTGERQRDEHVRVGELRDDAGLVATNQFTLDLELLAYRLEQARCEGPRESDLDHDDWPLP